jgi:DeoR/GlpR family transcriptional regulator of sugar metabolism
MINWFARHRQEWIAETLRVFGYINRNHLENKFGVTPMTASQDLKLFQAENPCAIEYDTRAKRYVAQTGKTEL